MLERRIFVFAVGILALKPEKTAIELSFIHSYKSKKIRGDMGRQQTIHACHEVAYAKECGIYENRLCKAYRSPVI